MRKILNMTILCLLICTLISSCARKPGSAAIDPYEKFNRFSFALNQCLDHLALRPVAKVYDTLTPPPLKKGVTNFFNNLWEIRTIPNDILQGKIRYALTDLWRFIINSTIGLGGLIDVAKHMGLQRHYEDFGMTLAYWSGKTKSPYLVIPVLGASTFRAGLGQLGDWGLSPWIYVEPDIIRWTARGVYAVNTRARLLPADKLVDTAFDPYIFVRNAYLQKRHQLIENNKQPYLSERQRRELAAKEQEQEKERGALPIIREQFNPISHNKTRHPFAQKTHLSSNQQYVIIKKGL